MAVISTLDSAKFGSNNQYGLRITVDLTAQSITDNTSTIVVRMYTVSSQPNGAYNLNDNNTVTLTVNGSTVLTSSKADLDFRSGNCPRQIDYTVGTTVNKVEYRTTVTHASDGTKSITVGGSVYFNSTSSSSLSKGPHPSGTWSATVALPTIPRASTVTATNVNAGTASVITISKAATTFYHNLSFAFNGQATRTQAVTHTSTLTETYSGANSTYAGSTIPNAKSGVCTVTCTTYSDSAKTNLLGTSTTTFTVTAPNDMAISTATAKDVSTQSKTDSGGASTNTLINGISTARVAFSGNASSGSTLKSAVVTYGSSSRSVTVSGNSIDTYIDIPNATETNSSNHTAVYTITLTDNRGYTKQATAVANVRSYSSPSVTLTVSRGSGTSGTATITGSGTKEILQSNNSSKYTNSITLTLKQRSTEDATWTTVLNAVTVAFSNATSYTKTQSLTGLDQDKGYEFEAIVQDTIYSGTKTATGRVKTYMPAYSWDRNVFNFNESVTFDYQAQTTDRAIWFRNDVNASPTPEHPHAVAITGGSATSERAIGLFDFHGTVGGVQYFPFMYRDENKEILFYAYNDSTGRAKSYFADFPNEVKLDTTTGLYYRKWYSGVAEVWGEKNVTTASYAQSGSLYLSPNPNSSPSVFSVPLPVTFSTATPTISVRGSTVCWGTNPIVSGSAITFSLLRTVAFGSTDSFPVQIHIIGTMQGYADRVYASGSEPPRAGAVVVTTEVDTGGGLIKHITAVDLSNDTVDAAHLISGYTAHDREGNAITGTHAP